MSQEENNQTDWTLDSIKDQNQYLPKRGKYFGDYMYILGAGFASILVIILFFAN